MTIRWILPLVSYYKKAGKIEDARRVLESVAQGDEHGQSGQSAQNELAVLDLESGNTAEAESADREDS